VIEEKGDEFSKDPKNAEEWAMFVLKRELRGCTRGVFAKSAQTIERKGDELQASAKECVERAPLANTARGRKERRSEREMSWEGTPTPGGFA